MKNQYELEKWKWNQEDFEKMGWHDNPIWAMSFDDDVKFDLDYLLKWVHPGEGGGSYRFWISPATLVFKSPSKLKVEMETDFVNGLEIADILKETIDGKTVYIIEAQEGRITIETEEYQQVIRRPPILSISQCLTDMQRGPISFSEISNIDYKPTDKELEYQKLSFNYYDLNTEKVNLQIEYDDYNFDQLDPKERIIKKRKYKERIEQLIKAVEIAEFKMNNAYEPT